MFHIWSTAMAKNGINPYAKLHSYISICLTHLELDLATHILSSNPY